MHLFDSHAHLTSEELKPHLPEIIQRAREKGVDHIINICTDLNSLHAGLAIQEKGIFHAGATTPHDVEKEGDAHFPYFAEAAEQNQLVAIGETGLDYHYKHADPKIQQKFLVRYLHLAAKVQLPVIFHCREAFQDLFAIVDAEYPKHMPAVLHCFTGNRKEAEGVLSRGWYLSLSGIVTFPKSEELRSIAKEIPLDQLLIETDAPFLAPQKMRGKRNEPAFIEDTAACIASVRSLETSVIAQKTRANGIRLFLQRNS